MGGAAGVSDDEERRLCVLRQVLLRWGLQRGCAVIPKTVRIKRLEECRPEALLSWRLCAADMAALDALEDARGGKVCWNPEDIL